MGAVNKAFLLGNLGADPVVRHLPDGRPVANVNLATTEVWRDQAGEQHKHTEWHRLTFYGRQAEIVSQYLKKGSPLFVEGQIRTRKWQDKEGNDRQTTEIRVLSFQMVGGRQDSEGGGRRPPRDDDAGRGRDAGGGDDNKEGGLDNLDEDMPW